MTSAKDTRTGQNSGATVFSPMPCIDHRDYGDDGFIVATLHELRSELRRRGLPVSGTKDKVVKRIEEYNASLYTARYQEMLTAFKEASLAAVVPFELFTKFTAEIRLMIWDLSLPGPRVLNSDGIRGNPPKPYFGKNSTPPNPAALFVCKESREVALQRYRLCFNTSSVYADFSKDTLHLGPGWVEYSQIYYIHANGQVQHGNSRNIAPFLITELESIRSLALCWRLCFSYCHTSAWLSTSGDLLRKEMAQFPNLQVLLLVQDLEERPTPMTVSPGQIVLRRPQQPRIFERNLFDVKREFKSLNLTDTEKSLSIPKVQVVRPRIVRNIPAGRWERQNGKLCVRALTPQGI